MDVTQGTADGGILGPLNGNWTLQRDAGTGRFARRFAFSLATGGAADGFRWLTNSGCTLSFPTFDYDAHAAGAPEAVALANSGGNDVQLSFLAPRTLLRVKITGAQTSDVVEARRSDGNVITDDAFASAGHGTAGAQLNANDVRLVLRQKRGSADVSLRATGIAEVVVRSAATNVRVGVVLPALSNDVFTLGPDAGAVLQHPQTPTNIGAAVAVLLQSACDRLTDSLGGALLPASVAMTLVIESDTPTQVHVSGFALRYWLVRRRFADSAPKRTFDFPGKSLSKQALEVELPHATTLHAATLRMMGALQVVGGANGGDAGNGGAPVSSAAVSDLGVTVNTGETAATGVQLTAAALVQGATVVLVGLTPGTVGRARLHADSGGTPGETLGEGTIKLTHAGAPETVRVDFDRSSVVSAGTVWVGVQCDNDVLLWLTAEPDATTAAAQVLKRAAGDVQWKAVGTADGRGPVERGPAGRGAVTALVTATVMDSSAAARTDSAFHGVQLRLGEQRLPGVRPLPGARGEKETHFDVTSALTPLLQHSPTGGLLPITLSLVSSEAGRVTVYPPEFEFDV